MNCSKGPMPLLIAAVIGAAFGCGTMYFFNSNTEDLFRRYDQSHQFNILRNDVNVLMGTVARDANNNVNAFNVSAKNQEILRENQKAIKDVQAKLKALDAKLDKLSK